MKSILFSLALLLAFLTAAAQTDTTRVIVTEEVADSSDFSAKEPYRYDVRGQVEERSILKIGLNNAHILFASRRHITASVAYEHKLTNTISVLGELKQQIPLGFHTPRLPSLNAGARYYHNLKERMRKGKSANGFSANYIGIYQQNIFMNENDRLQYEPMYQLVYGVQRRFGKRAFVDVFGGPGHRFEDGTRIFVFRIGVSAGIAF